MAMLADLFLRTFGLAEDVPVMVIEDHLARQLEADLAFAFPPLTRIEPERQAITNRRARYAQDLDTVRLEREWRKAEIIDLDADEADIVRILAGLDKHEAELGGAVVAIAAEPKRRARKLMVAA
ncbi:hypothetical protein NKH73_14055 [Mesorhizobium sp. M0938]|uniref:hypothetical protein n=1 Tax=unclassified Mesorhizobium TaxID=325217 RepID=UPI00333A7FCF